MNALQHARHAAVGARARDRAGAVSPTAGLAPELIQANMISLPRDWAYDFLRFAQCNPQACPVLDVSEPGSRCTFTFDTDLMNAGIDVRHSSECCNVPMYRVCRPAGRLQGEMVVSTLPIAADRVAGVVKITARYPRGHGSPVHVGEPALLGIKDISRPDFADAVRTKPGEIPAFWACGVTPQSVVVASCIPFTISQSPGHRFISDIPNSYFHA